MGKNLKKLGLYILFLLILSLNSLSAEENEINEIFDVIPNPVLGPDKYGYYIKKKFYTPENIETGRAFFELNCAVCHGTEADGSGVRAGTMKEAKPRMLTNLDWSLTRDDLRLLRSIKYGVAGTAMTPWGDLTSSLQRLQLVIFIRSLTQDRLHREQLSTDLYQSFERNILAVENARIHEYPQLAKIKDRYNELQNKRIRLYEKYEAGSTLPQEATEVYQQELETLGELKKREEIDTTLTELKSLIAKERDIYNEIGLSLLKLNEDDDFKKFLKLIEYNEGRYRFSEGKLRIDFDKGKEEKIATISKEIIEDLSRQLEEANKDKVRLEGKMASPERSNELAAINTKLTALTKIKTSLVSGFEEAVRLRQKQQELFKQYELKTKTAI